ncbi:hypothetical protein MC378_14610 [Polaribacter sp. MSW13]|uniref:Uncharacterized protein n=1 Tax=Polaribacter marinus TaxID=2916838 RepID=A0A9X1VRA3_9FLAO|nr:hypothetical protein [Polaribacter marinus]MCI2230408.1 hypothetical protein [Polaribacter marinus]
MKKLFFILAFMLIGTVTFANNLKTESKEKIEIIKKKNFNSEKVIRVTLKNGVLFCEELHIVYFNGERIGEFWVETQGVNGPCGITLHMVEVH